MREDSLIDLDDLACKLLSDAVNVEETYSWGGLPAACWCISALWWHAKLKVMLECYELLILINQTSDPITENKYDYSVMY